MTHEETFYCQPKPSVERGREREKKHWLLKHRRHNSHSATREKTFKKLVVTTLPSSGEKRLPGKKRYSHKNDKLNSHLCVYFLFQSQHVWHFVCSCRKSLPHWLWPHPGQLQEFHGNQQGVGSLCAHARLPVRHGDVREEKQPQLPEIPGAKKFRIIKNLTTHLCPQIWLH